MKDRLRNESYRPVVLITGTSSGFGLCMVKAFADQGFQVIATLRNLNRRKDLDDLIESHQAKQYIDVWQLDVSDSESIKQCIDGCISKFSRIDCLVNNAGTGIPGFLEEVTPDVWATTFNTNFFGGVNLTQAVLPHMRQMGYGKIIIMSSLGGRVPTPILGTYCASKFALEGYAETLRLELLPFNIDVILVEPGAFNTSIWSHFNQVKTNPDSPYSADYQKLVKLYGNMNERLGHPQIVAKKVAKLATKRRTKLRYIVGRDAIFEVILQRILPWRIYEHVARRLVGL